MVRTKTSDLVALLEELRAQVAALSERMAKLEPRPVSVTAPPAPVPEPISEEELAAISAAVAAYLGVRAHIRQIRLVSSARWAQEGRVWIQASHRLHT